MKYNEVINEALKIAYSAHLGQVDKSGVPYIFHPFYVAMQMDNTDEIVTALLHDVLEDSDITIDEIENIGVSKKVVEALLLLTHDESMKYLDYIEKLKTNDLARKVKLADLHHNSDESRLEADTQKTRERREKYKKAIEILDNYEKKLNL